MELLEKNDFVLIVNNKNEFNLIKKSEIFSISLFLKKENNQEQAFLNSLKKKLTDIGENYNFYQRDEINSLNSIKNYSNKIEKFLEFLESYQDFNYLVKENKILQDIKEIDINLKDEKNKDKIDKDYINNIFKIIDSLSAFINMKISEFDEKGKNIKNLFLNLFYKDKNIQIEFKCVDIIRDIEIKFTNISSLILETLLNIKSNVVFNDVIFSLLLEKGYILNKGNENGYYFN